MRTFFLLLAAFFFVGCICYDGILEEQKVVKISLGKDVVKNLNRLMELNIQLERKVSMNASTVKAHLLEGHEELLKSNGFNFTHIETLRPVAEKRSVKRGGEGNPIGRYHNYVQLEEFLNWITQRHPNITRVYSIGTSVQGRKLYVIDISKNVNQEEKEPKFKYVGNMHGNFGETKYL